MTRPSISVIVPTYNDGQFLGRALASLTAQRLLAAEVIVVDDGTSDPDALRGIEQALATYPDTILLRQANAGPSVARNAGIAAATGTFIAFLDADDEYDPGCLSSLHTAVGADPQTVASYGAITFVEPNNVRTRSSYRSGLQPMRAADIGERRGIPGFLWAYLFRQEALRRAGGLDPSLDIMEDFDLLARISRQGGMVAGIDAITCIQHRRRGSLARGSARRQVLGALRFLAKARREGYFPPGDLLRRYLRVPVAGLKIVVRYRLRGTSVS